MSKYRLIALLILPWMTSFSASCSALALLKAIYTLRLLALIINYWATVAHAPLQVNEVALRHGIVTRCKPLPAFELRETQGLLPL
jgi:hypothetical protein